MIRILVLPVQEPHFDTAIAYSAWFLDGQHASIRPLPFDRLRTSLSMLTVKFRIPVTTQVTGTLSRNTQDDEVCQVLKGYLEPMFVSAGHLGGLEV
ncbi:MAG: hypothetical protein MAG451_00034 [Anaerolineales bacterium]|nr:hypothetical protein [Anaerolineales bacterium]